MAESGFLKSNIRRFVHWMKQSPSAAPLFFWIGLSIALLLVASGLKNDYKEHAYHYAILQFSEYPLHTKLGYVLDFARTNYVIFLACLTPWFLLVLARRKKPYPILLAALLSLALLILWLPSDLHANYLSLTQSHTGEIPSVDAYIVKLVLIAVLIVSLPIMIWLYSKLSILDRYVIRSFASPFFLCLFGFISILIILDLTDNGGDFLEGGAEVSQVLSFYVTQLPFTFVQVIPIALLLATLFTMSKMSRSNEVISMLGAGRSMLRVLSPLIAIGVYATFICGVLNFEWSPWAIGNKEAMLRGIVRGSKSDIAYEAHYYQNREDHRDWFVQRIPYDLKDSDMRGVVISQYDEEGNLLTRWSADRIHWFPNGSWRLYRGVRWDYTEVAETGVVKQLPFHDADDPALQHNGDYKYDLLEEWGDNPWRETPWSIISNEIDREHLGVPRLASYLNSNADAPEEKLAPFKTQFHYRLALPFNCLVVMLVAAPLGVVYSRRGALGGVASSIFIFFSLLFVTHLFLALAESRSLPPALGAWAPNLIFGLVGAYLLWVRARNRELPKIGLGALVRLFTRRTPEAT